MKELNTQNKKILQLFNKSLAEKEKNTNDEGSSNEILNILEDNFDGYKNIITSVSVLIEVFENDKANKNKLDIAVIDRLFKTGKFIELADIDLEQFENDLINKENIIDALKDEIEEISKQLELAKINEFTPEQAKNLDIIFDSSKQIEVVGELEAKIKELENQLFEETKARTEISTKLEQAVSLKEESETQLKENINILQNQLKNVSSDGGSSIEEVKAFEEKLKEMYKEKVINIKNNEAKKLTDAVNEVNIEKTKVEAKVETLENTVKDLKEEKEKLNKIVADTQVDKNKLENLAKMNGMLIKGIGISAIIIVGLIAKTFLM